MSESYSKEEFEKLCFQCGYASNNVIKEWILHNQKDKYNNDDFIEVYRKDYNNMIHSGRQDWRDDCGWGD